MGEPILQRPVGYRRSISLSIEWNPNPNPRSAALGGRLLTRPGQTIFFINRSLDCFFLLDMVSAQQRGKRERNVYGYRALSTHLPPAWQVITFNTALAGARPSSGASSWEMGPGQVLLTAPVVVPARPLGHERK